MIEDFEDAGSEADKESGEQRAHRLKRIVALLGQLRRLEQQPAADVKDDEGRDQRRVAKYAGAHFRLHRSVLGKSEILRLNQETANHHADHSRQHTGGEQIAGDVKWIPETAAGMDAEEAFQNIDKVNQEVKNESVEDHRVEQRHHRPLLEHALLGQNNPQGTADAARQIVEARIRLAPGDRPVNVVKLVAAVVKRAGGEQNKRNLFQCRQHRGATVPLFQSLLNVDGTSLSKYSARNYHWRGKPPPPHHPVALTHSGNRRAAAAAARAKI